MEELVKKDAVNFESIEDSKNRKAEEKKRKKELEAEKKIEREKAEEEEERKKERAEEELRKKEEEKLKAEREKEVRQFNEQIRKEMEQVDDLERSDKDLHNLIEVKQPISVEPLNVEFPEIIDWSVDWYLISSKIDKSGASKIEKIKIDRSDGSVKLWKSFNEVARNISRADLIKMYEIGIQKGLKQKEEFTGYLEKPMWEYICMMFEPENYFELWGYFRQVIKWEYYARPGIHSILFKDRSYLWMLTEREYDMNIGLLRSLKHARLFANLNDEVAQNLVYMILNQLHKKELIAKIRHGKKGKN